MTLSILPVAAAAAVLTFSPNVDSSGRARTPARVGVTIDTTGAGVVLAAALADPPDAPHAADVALQNPAVRAMIAKMAMYDHNVTAEAFKSAVISLASGG